MSKDIKKVVVIGHKNPDTDSICSAIAYAELKNKTGELVCEARRAGNISQETAFVLKKFGFKAPRICADVYPKVRDVDYRREKGVSGDLSLRNAWQMIRDKNLHTLPIVNENKKLLGIINVNDVAMANMDFFDTTVLAKSSTSYKNILETLGGTMLVGSENKSVTKGNIVIGAADPHLMESAIKEGDIVIVSNRSESQICAIEMKASLVIVCQNAQVSDIIQKLASASGVDIMSVPGDTYTTAKLISQSAPISYYMVKDNIMHCTLLTPVEQVERQMANVRHSYFPVLGENGKLCGMISRRNLLSGQKRRLILVDHNESSQAIEGWESAEILEIIDHHRIGSLETVGPVYFRNQPVGCTATIITQMYDEAGVEITAPIAGLLVSAIISDTLMFRSPTCTAIDKNFATRLAKIAGININTFASEMFEAGELVEGKTAEEVFLQDFKIFTYGEFRFGVAQGSYMSDKNREEAQKLIRPYLKDALVRHNIEDVFMLFTDIEDAQSTVLCSGAQANAVLEESFKAVANEKGDFLLSDVVSRKKQFIPKIMAGYQNI